MNSVSISSRDKFSGLRIEEVDERKEEEVEYAKIDVSLVADVVDADRRNCDDHVSATMAICRNM